MENINIKTFEDIKTLEDIKNLISDKTPENSILEYKRELGENNLEIVKDISAFANR